MIVRLLHRQMKGSGVPADRPAKPDDSPHVGAAMSHLAAGGSARMVDVGEKPISGRSATAEGFVRVSPALARAIGENTVEKGSVLETARLAGILAAKRTDELIPLCHPLPLDMVDVSAALEPETTDSPCRVRVIATVRAHARTGVEMEALTAVAAACLTIVDMGKAIDKGMVIEGLRVLEKHGGRSGAYVAPPAKTGGMPVHAHDANP